jgi:hypothetical protein
MPHMASAFRASVFSGRCQPGTLTCRGRATVSVSAGASRETVLPPPMVAPRPIRIGATSTQFDPMLALSSITVRCLLAPS